MSLNINPSTSEANKQLFAEILLSKTTKISKISDNSVVSGISYGVGKVSQKAEKDIVLALSKLFPDSAFGTQLSQVAQNNGVADRFSTSQSSTYVRVVGDTGTVYIAGTHIFNSSTGKQFDIEQTTSIGSAGFTYIKVRSIDSGITTNVAAGTITTVTPTPIGHRFVVNEYQASGGRDNESDLDFRQRIKDGPNILAKGTLAAIEQAFMKINNNILRVKYQGVNSNGQLKLAILTQNGIELNLAERNTLLLQGEQFFGLSELRPFGRKSYGIELVNIEIQPFDISFRCQLDSSFNVNDIIVSIQTRIGKYIDPRFFQPGVTQIQWDQLLRIVQDTKGVKYVPDEYFFPSSDIATDPNKIPRLRGFLMLNLDGSVVNNQQGSLNPVFYPAQADFSYQSTVLASI